MPVLSLETVRAAELPIPGYTGGKGKQKPLVWTWVEPVKCDYGCAYNQTLVSAWAAEHGGATYVPPIVPTTAQTTKEYLFPPSPCATPDQAIRPATHKGCPTCAAHVSNWQRTIRDYPDFSALYKRVETVLQRRLRHWEAKAIIMWASDYDIQHITARNNSYDAEVAGFCRGSAEHTAFMTEFRYSGPKAFDEAMSHCRNRAKRAWEANNRSGERAESRARAQLKSASVNERAVRIANMKARLELATKIAGDKKQAISPLFFKEPTEPVDIVVPNRPEPDEDGELPCGHHSSRGCRCYLSEGITAVSQHGMPFLHKGPGCKRLVGVELEYNDNVDLSAWVTKWRGNVHRDGSCGYEAVTTPIAGNHIDSCLRDLCKALKKQNAEADERCGIHVHVDANDIRWADMVRLLRIYSVVEPVLYLMAGQQRIAGRYCQPCGQVYAEALQDGGDNTELLKKEIAYAAFHDTEDVGRFVDRNDGARYLRCRPGKKDGARYRGLNLVPWFVGRRVQAPDTTIEFRLHRNSLDATRIAGWAHLMAEIVDFANRSTDAEVKALPKSALRMLIAIAPFSKAFIIKRVKEWRGATTSARGKHSDAAGNRIPKRRIGIVAGVWTIKNLKKDEQY